MGKRFVGSALGAALLMFAALIAVPAEAAACPNEALRQGASALLPECRAYELVSPADKGDGYVLTFYGAKASPDGDGFAYLSTAALPNGGGSPLFVVDLARRDAATGWTSTGIDPPFLNSNSLAEVTTPAVSLDLGEALQVSRRALAPGAIEGGSNLYVRDDATGALSLIRAEAGEELNSEFAIFSGKPYVGGSPDWSHLVLRSRTPLVDGLPNPGVVNLYDFTGGRVEVVDRLPNGEIPAQGASAAGEEAGPSVRHGVSSDGSRVYFWLGNEGEGPLYMREDDRRTVPISVSRKAGPEAGEVVPVRFEYASSDGSVAYFSSASELTEGASPNAVYRYELAGDKLTDLTPSSPFATDLIVASEDGSYVYFTNRAALSGEATEAPEGETNLYLWHDGQVKLVVRIGSAGFSSAQVSPNGEHLGFVSAEPLTAADVATGACPSGPVAGHCAQVFDYEAAGGGLTCVTCDGPASGDSGLGTLSEVYLLLGEHNSRAVLDNGSVIVDTPNRLVARDSNGVEDVYLWRGGVTSLISSGTSEEPSNFADASPDGSNIFFRTNQRLVPVDTDSTTDVYDARVEGGLAVQNPPGSPPACESEACRGSSPAGRARPRSAVTSPPAPTCSRLGQRARGAAAAAKRLGKRAARAAGHRADHLRAAATRQRSKARHLHRRAAAAGGGRMRARAILAASLAALVLAVLAPGAQAEFGISSFSGSLNDAAGQPLRQAGAHPDLETTIQFPANVKAGENPGEETVTVEENVKDVKIHLPAGLVGNPTTAPTCSQTGLRGNGYVADCPIGSQVGTVDLYFTLSGTTPQRIPLFNLAPPPGVPAQFGFNYFQARVFIDSHVVADPSAPGGYTIESDSLRTTQALALTGVTVHLWGVPASPSHDLERVEEGGELQNVPPGGVKSPEATEPPLFDNPGSCTSTPGRFTAEANSWADPAFHAAAFEADPGSDPFVFTGCESLPFEPSVEVQPTTREADSPSGLKVAVRLPQNENPQGLAAADLKSTVLTLPEGMTIDPSSAGGLLACSNAQIGLGEDAPAGCPEGSKIGSVEIDTPLLDHPVTGGVYLARQGENKFGSLLAIYLAVDDPLSGTVIKLPGKIETSPTGRLTASFLETPQLPFEELKVELFGGQRAPLRTPGTCGTYTSQAAFTPWSGTPTIVASDSFRIDSGPGGSACPNGGFAPKLEVSTADPLAGRYSPLSFEISRADGTQTLAGLELALPQGVLGKLAGVPYCPDAVLGAIPAAAGTGAAELASPACPAASKIGTVAVAAGAGAIPIQMETGSVYLAGPYKGAPLSLAVVVPALAGPFDLGNVVVRSALRVDPVTTQVTAVSDPFPQILQGIPLDLREVAVSIDRQSFILNPTSCAPSAVAATIAGGGGARAAASQPFQVAGCSGLRFAPRLALALSGSTSRGGYPALAATVRARPGEANIARVSVALPHSEFLAQNHIGTICTRVQFAEGETPGEKCPQASIYGRATAISPLLGQPLSGPVYLRSSSRTLPDLVVALNGQIDVDLDGRIDTFHGGIRTSFEAVPDAPISKFTLKLKGGAKSLLQNSADLCRSPVRATVRMTGHSGRAHDVQTPVRAACPARRKAR